MGGFIKSVPVLTTGSPTTVFRDSGNYRIDSVYTWNPDERTSFNHQREYGPRPVYPDIETWYPSGPKKFGFVAVAGPCSIESETQIQQIAKAIKKCGIRWMRGGVFRAGTYPGDMFGLQMELLKAWKATARAYGLQIVVEMLDLRQLDLINRYADAIQIGARHMQDYVMLKEVSRIKKPVLLKRYMGSTLDEFLGAAEYLCQGKCSPILVERGSSTYHNHVRWELSVSTIAAIKRLTKIPILVDASHGSGRRDLVEPLTLAGIASGADGYLVETHPDPEKSISDADQAIPLNQLGRLHKMAKGVYALANSCLKEPS